MSMLPRCCIWGFPLAAALLMLFPGGAARGVRPEVRNVILIVVDTLAAQHLGFMGYERDTSPFMDELASRSIIFDRAYTPKSETLPSFTSIFSGLHPRTHRVLENGVWIPETVHMLTEDFRDAGFITWGVPAFRVIDGSYGLKRGFTFYANAPALPHRAPRIIERVSGLLEGHQLSGEPSFVGETKPLFLFTHFYDPHTEFTPDPDVLAMFADPLYDGPVDGTWELFKKYNNYEIEFDEADLRHVRDLYDAEIRTFDNNLREFFVCLERVGLMENSVIVFTADHGENLGEHHFITHGHPYEKSLHVPLLVHFPDNKAAGTRIDVLVETTDIMPTLMDLMGIPIPGNLDGSSLMPLLTESGEPYEHGRSYLAACGRCDDNGDRSWSVFDGKYRFTRGVDWMEEPVLYDIFLDPMESENIASQNPDLVEYFEALLTIAAGDGLPHEPFEMDAETREMLESLGYLH